jgi:uncharacterized membrane protein YkgB
MGCQPPARNIEWFDDNPPIYNFSNKMGVVVIPYGIILVQRNIMVLVIIPCVVNPS